jgi:acetyltransferase
VEQPRKVGLDSFFRPRGIAIVGASAKPGSPGNQIVQFASEMSGNADIQIYPVNPTRHEVAGVKCYPSLLAIPGPVDLVVLAVASQFTLDAAKEIRQRRGQRGDVGAVAVISAGFKETGTTAGEQLQRELVSTITMSGTRLIGPNCQGVVDTYAGVNTTFSVPPDTPRGGVSIVSQSGAFATSFLRWARDMNLVGINKFVSLGNMADVKFKELLSYLQDDDSTKVISMYLDGMTDARSMFEVARKVTLKKPIVAIKAGKTAEGSNVAHSHTASIAGNNDIYDGAFRQAGIIRAQTVAEFYHTSRVFDKAPLPKGNRICILTVVGGPSTICVDELASTGEVVLAHFSDDLKKQLSQHLVASANIGNPDGYIDMTASVNPKMHTEVLKLLMQDDNIDGIVFMTTPPGFIGDEELAEAILEGYRSVPVEKRKPLLSVMLAGNAVRKCRLLLEAGGLPTFEYPDDAARVMINLVKYSSYRQRSIRPQESAAAPLKMDCHEIIGRCISGGATVFPEIEAQKICQEFGISCPATVVASSEEECIAAAETMGFPVVIKVVSPQIIHKSDVGGVITGIKDAAQLRSSYCHLLESVAARNPGAEIQGVLVQKQVAKGVEVVVGGLRNAQFGPVVMVGFGGIYVEVFKDVSFRLAPLDREEAMRQVKETKVYKLLQGVRGEPSCDIEALCNVIVSAGQMISSVPQISEIDFNPVFCYPDGCKVVDARLVLEPALRGELQNKSAVAGK